jgi:hypothetical protein
MSKKKNAPISVSPSDEEQTKAINTLTRDDILQQVGLCLSTLPPTAYSYDMVKPDMEEVVKVTVWKDKVFLGQCHLYDGAFAPYHASDDPELAREWEEMCRVIRSALWGRTILKPLPIAPGMMDRLEKTIPIYDWPNANIGNKHSISIAQVKKDKALLRELKMVPPLP